MKLFTAISHDTRLLPHFLAHYQQAGITGFFIAVDPRFEAAASKLKLNYNIVLYTDLDVIEAIVGGSAAVAKMRHEHQGPGEWAMVVDLDEFVEFGADIREVTNFAEQERANVVRAVMWDRFTRDGRPACFDGEGDLDSLFPIRARFIKNVMHGTDFKGVLVKGLLKAHGAHHRFEDEIVCSRELELSHYKWFDDAVERLRTAYRMVSDAAIPWAGEYARALEHYDRAGRFVWEEFGGEYIEHPLPDTVRPGRDLSTEDVDGISEALATRDANLALMRNRLHNAEAEYSHLWHEYEYYLQQCRSLKDELEAASRKGLELEPDLVAPIRAGYTLTAAEAHSLSQALLRYQKQLKELSRKSRESETKLEHIWKEYEYYLERSRQLESKLSASDEGVRERSPGSDKKL